MKLAVFGKNSLFGSKILNSHEQVFGYSVPVFGQCLVIPKSLRDLHDTMQSKRHISTVINSRPLHIPKCKVGDVVKIFREKSGWLGPGRVESISDDAQSISVLIDGKLLTSSPRALRVLPHERDIQDVPLLQDCASDDESSDVSKRSDTDTNNDGDDQAHVTGDNDGSSANETDDVSRSETSSENSTIVAGRGPTSSPRRSARLNSSSTPSTTYYFTTKEFYFHSSRASHEEKLLALKAEHDSWVSNSVFIPVSRHEVPRGLNIIPSIVIYRWKESGRLKARICPRGDLDRDKEQLRVDAPTALPTHVRLFCSLAASKKWEIRSCDVTTAFLQTGPMDRAIFIKPPHEMINFMGVPADTIWRMQVTVYGLVEGPFKWSKHLSKLFGDFGLTSTLGQVIFYKDDFVVLRQVDDLLYAGTPNLLAAFENYFRNQVQVGTWGTGKFVFNGVTLKQLDDYSILFSQNDTVRQLQEVEPSTSRSPRDPASAQDKTLYLSALGKLIWIGQNSIPYASCVASMFARKSNSLLVSDILSLNKEIRFIRTLSAVLTFQAPDLARSSPVFLVFSDADLGTSSLELKSVALLLSRLECAQTQFVTPSAGHPN